MRDIDSFLEHNYVSIIEKQGWKKVDKVYLPDGTYHKEGSGYQFSLNVSLGQGKYTNCGYIIITNDGIRGSYRRAIDTVDIVNGVPLNENVYKILTNDYNNIRDIKIKNILE